jgi:hypothetical protein
VAGKPLDWRRDQTGGLDNPPQKKYRQNHNSVLSEYFRRKTLRGRTSMSISHRKILSRHAISVALFTLLFSACAFAQFRAGLQGTVVDPNGALVPGAAVTLTSQETAAEHTTTTTGEGVFTLSSLAPGKYTLAVEKPGFRKKTLSDLDIAAEQVQSVRVSLEIGQTSSSVTVSSEAAQIIDTESATIGGTITTKEVESLPSFTRDPYQLLQLAPGVFGDGSLGAGGGGTQLPGTNKSGPGSTDSIFQVENGPGIIANGTRQNSNNFQIDGLSVNSTVWGGSAVITPNEESVKEVVVIANNYSAENGRTSGAQVEVVSQNGTNNLHGSAFFKWHRPGLNAFQAYNGPGTPSPVEKDESRFNQFGGSVGGPVKKNKVFAFFSYETLRNNSQSVATNWYETPQFEQMAGPAGSIARKFLSYPGTAPSVGTLVTLTCAQVGLPSTQCHDVSGGLDLGSPLKTPLGTMDPTFGQAATPYGIGGGFDGIPDAEYVETKSPNNVTDAQYNGRMDFDPTTRDTFVFSIYWVPVHDFDYNGPAREANAWNHYSTADATSVIYTHTFTPTFLNEARFGVSGWYWNEITSNPQEPFGLPTANITGAGSVGFQQFGAPGPSVFNQKTYNVRDTLTKVAGSHYIKFGGDYSRALFLDTAPWGGRPNYDFYNIWDFANDAPHDETGNFNPLTGQPTSATKNIRFDIDAAFVQDDWKIRPNLTINMGLRWEYFGPLTETAGNISNVILGSNPDPLAGLYIHKGGDLFHTSLGDFGPSLGFAFSPSQFLGHSLNNKFVIRGGGGIGYNLEQLAITSNGRFNPPFLTSFTLLGSNIFYQVGSSLTSLDSYPSNPATVQSFNSYGLPTSGAPVSLTGFPNNMPSTMTVRYSLDADYNLGRDWVASVGFQGSQTRHYTIQNFLNYTLYPSSNPMVQSLDWYSNDANSSYSALLTEIKHRFASTFEIDAQYRYAASTDQGSQDYYVDNYPWNLSHSKGPSDFDVTNNFKLYGIWNPKLFPSGNHFLNSVFGGWTVSGIFNAHSGFPFTPQYCNTGGNVLYPNSGFYCLYPASYTGGAGSNTGNGTFEAPNGNFPNGALAYLTVPTFPANGIPPDPASNIHRNMFRGPGYSAVDMVLAKAFTLPRMKLLGEGAKLNLQASAYNLFNQVNLNNVNTTISNDGVTSNPQFGQAQGAFGGRIVELQARFSF